VQDGFFARRIHLENRPSGSHAAAKKEKLPAASRITLDTGPLLFVGTKLYSTFSVVCTVATGANAIKMPEPMATIIKWKRFMEFAVALRRDWIFVITHISFGEPAPRSTCVAK